MKISINVTPESPEELARLFAFISGRDGIELPPLAAADVAKASAEENALADAEEAKKPAKKPAKKAAKKAPKKAKSADTKEARQVEATADTRKQVELDLRAEATADTRKQVELDLLAQVELDTRKQVELDLRAFAAEHGMPELRDALKAAELPRLQDAADADLPKFRAVIDGLRASQQGDLL